METIRAKMIFLLTHAYPIFIAGHLYFGDWCRLCQVMFNIIPLIVFGGLFFIWKENSYLRLTKNEMFYISFLMCNMAFIIGYYIICIFSLPVWVYDKNYQVASFILITFILYTIKYRDRQ